MMNLHIPPVKVLPHSYPFILIDRIVEFEYGKRIVCLKNVSVNEEYFQGHFRDNPVMPGVLILEAMAQSSGLVFSGRESKMFYLGSIGHAKFKKPVVPGDQLIINSSIINKLPPLYTFEAEAYVEGEIVSVAEITLALK
ncbi:MAG: beta-hydroxyacyl-ACP dehydratase [Planctomycetes bacterium]|nr:beta-hydroxyacyl-ACP dehydratase [Planctomycetota bacterium]